MDEKDATRAIELIKGAELIDGFKSTHDIHQYQSQQFEKVLIVFKNKLE
ncbi:hypothetical protein LQF61_07045 [Tetragenococcus koreensis]|nr:hypothetical protein [Tetragenococcus koreensis]MDN6640827.1 hypothetical protein [Tetragenococcus sp.]MDN6722512.1 hypothetical protein [Staphylococcus equorum]MCF1584404.1 hypothetical protein [Tetragenococcus koreensis]MCF1613953.1 hypothetical protein [Tetragenococcus koreensis]MCF1619831.1 hypothetical protein [Tetragenococcus koreensis]